MAATGYTGGGGGGGGTPSNTVVSETTFGQAANAGNAATFSRGNHTHGTPPTPTGSTPSGTVVSERVLNNAAASAGASTDYSRGDHTHGTPPMPTAAQVGADPSGLAAAALASALAADPQPASSVVTETSFGQAQAVGTATIYARQDHTHGTPAAPSVPSASGTVTSETAFGQASSAGAAATFSRGDHTHGTPAAPTIPSASGTVASETSFGISTNAGAAATFSRGDHTHGSPTAPTAASVGAIANSLVDAKGDILTATADNTPARLAVGADGLFLKADSSQATGLVWAAGGGSGSLKTTVQAFLTSGDVTVANGPGFTVIGSDLTIAAAAGDRLAIDIEAMCATAGSDCQFEACTRVSGANTNFWSSGNGTSRNPGGIASWYCSSGFVGPRGRSYYTVQAGDIVTGNVTVRILGFGSGGSRVVNANANYPFRWALSNVGA